MRAPTFLNTNKRQNSDDDDDDDADGLPLSMDSDDAKTSSRRGRARESVDYSELAIDSEGNEKNSGGGRKRKSTKKRSKPVRKRLRQSRGDSDDIHSDSDFAPSDENSDDGSLGSEEDSYVVAKGSNSSRNAKHCDSSDDDAFADTDLTDTESDEPEQEEKGEKKKKMKSAEKINWDEIELDVPKAKMTAEKERRIEYRKAAEKVHRYLKAVDNLKLPPNPLDELLNELGGKRSRPL